MHSVRTQLIKKRGYPRNIAGDSLSLYLSNSPAAAKWLAKRIGNPRETLLELCCSVGITLSYMSKAFKKAIGVDINKQALYACKKNIANEGLKNCTVIRGDVRDLKVLKRLSGDIVLYDIPYWYPEKYPLYTSRKRAAENPDLSNLISNTRKHISSNIVIFASPETNHTYFKNLLGKCECVKIYIDGKHDRNYIFLGKLAKRDGTGSIKFLNYSGTTN